MSSESQDQLDRMEKALVQVHARQRAPEPTAAWRESVMRDVAAAGAPRPAQKWVASGSAVLWPFAGVAATLAVAAIVYLTVVDPGVAEDLADFYFNHPADYAMIQLVGL